MWNNYIKVNDKWTIENSLCAEFDGLNENELFILKNKTIGGVNPDNKKQIAFWGLPDNYLLYANKAIYKTGLRYKLADKIFLKSIINIAVVDEFKYYLGGGFSFIYNSPIGPLSASIGGSPDYNSITFHISMGFFR